jgi:hypothetical protein
MKKTGIIAVLLLVAHFAAGQGKEHRFEEDMVFEMTWSDDAELFINGEQADVTVKTHKEDNLKCIFTRSSRHADKDVAKKELAMMNLFEDKSKNGLSLRNFVLTNSGKKPAARLKGTFVIYVPEQATGGLLKIWNYFGTVDIKDVNCPVELKLEFSNLKMEAMTADASIQMKYGEGLVYDCGGQMKLKSDRANVEIDHHSGSVDINALYSEIEVMHPAAIESLIVKAKKSELFLDIPMAAGPGYAITTTNTELKALTGPELEGTLEEDKIKLSYKPKQVSGFAEIEMETGKLNYILK